MSNNTLQFDLTARREKNLRVLKSIDENVTEILEDYSHVAVYEFDSSQRKWERLDVEGSLFITRSLSDPFYSLIVLNKKGPSDFALDILNVSKISLQRPYLMLRCATAGAPITFGIWSHSDAELDSLYAIIVRIALNKESPVAPPSPHQVKTAQLLSVLKLRKDNTGTNGAAVGSPRTPTSNTASAAAFLSPEAPQIGTSGKQNGSSAKASALLSLLKPNGSGENTTVQSSVASLVVEENASGASKSMQLLSLLKQVSQSPAPAAKAENNNNNGNTKSNGLNHIKVHKPSANSPTNSPAPTATSGSARSMEEDKRAELMMKLIKPRNTTVDDLLTDVDIAAKVKAAAAAPAASTPVEATEPSSIISSNSKQDLLKNLLMKSKSPAPSTSSTPIPVPVPAMVLPSAAAGSSVARSPSPAVPVCAAAVGFLPIPTPPGRSTAASPVTGTTASAAAATNATAAGESATQRSADLLAAALRHSAQHIRTIQAATAASAANAATSTAGPSLTPTMVAARTPSASPVLKGMQAPVAWASLSSRENSFSLQQGGGLSAGIAANGSNNGSAAGGLSSKGPSPLATTVNGAVPPRAQPVLISPSDLRNIAAASR